MLIAILVLVSLVAFLVLALVGGVQAVIRELQGLNEHLADVRKEMYRR